jgi:hypothetical protein
MAWILGFVVLATLAVGADASLLRNGGFREGEEAPAGWRLVGQGAWEASGPAGGRAVTVTGAGGEASSFWRAEGFAPKPGALYRLSFLAKGRGSQGGVIAGLDVANRDFGYSEGWQRRSFVLQVPEGSPDAYLRLGQWNVRGSVSIADVQLSRVVPVHRSFGSVLLGEGESLVAGRYLFQTTLTGEAGNFARPLERQTTAFNSNRWVLSSGKEVVFRHQIAGSRQSDAQVTVAVGYHVAGACRVEASADGKGWRLLGRVSAVSGQSFPVPVELLPAPTVWVRLSGEAQQPGGDVNLQVYGYAYSAKLDKRLPDAAGATHFLELRKETPGLRVEVADLGPLLPGEGSAAWLRVAGAPGASASLTLREPGRSRGVTTSATLPAAGSGLVKVPYRLTRAGSGSLTLAVRQGRRLLWEAATPYQVSRLHAADYGYPLASRAPVDLWWCEGTYKVSRDRPAPRADSGAKPRPVSLEAARGEYEPVQVVLRPRRPLTGLRAAMGDLVSAKGRIPASSLEVRRVGYVRVTSPTDAQGEAAEWPDPLPPLREPLNLAAGKNQPLWLTVHVPVSAPAGLYRGLLRLVAEGWSHEVPVRLRVWGFALPRVPHITTALGLSPGLLKEYHHLESEAELQQVWDLYMRDFARHRISPYNPMALAPIAVTVQGDDVKVDFSAFDQAAERYLDGLGFTTFSLPVEGMGGGTFFERSQGTFGGHRQGTPEYDALMGKYLRTLQDHLESKGWLSKAYVYWFDEPAERDYPFVREGMEILKRHAPKLARMLTKHPSPELQDVVDVWCPILDDFDAVACQAQAKLGRRVWWYVCTGPKSPYTTLFIDHPAVNLRTWCWMSEKYGVNGLLVWETHYWTSDTAFPPPQRQDPYADPMSYVVGYGTPPGTRAFWGNGDGRFIYPPEGWSDGRKRIEGPVDSLRWEMLREGLEDADTFEALRAAIAQAEKRGVSSALLAGARKLLEVPPSVARSPSDYNHDPQPLYRHRHEMGGMVEKLIRGGL